MNVVLYSDEEDTNMQRKGHIEEQILQVLRSAHQVEGIASFRFLEWSVWKITPGLEMAVRNQP